MVIWATVKHLRKTSAQRFMGMKQAIITMVAQKIGQRGRGTGDVRLFARLEDLKRLGEEECGKRLPWVAREVGKGKRVELLQEE